ncbi:MAG: S8 family serine peptidase [Synechococcus sp. SB0677_bin_5]|nr:S8 family serine peptidase [Synechococcus sp. SB0677_bin_5]
MEGTIAKPSSPAILAGLVARIGELQGHSIAVVSVGEAGTISFFSNRCGIAGNGTSYATPMVSGGLAIMKQLFRDQLSSEQLVSRLFTTANDDGIHADSAIYGQGLMDLGAATSPWRIPAFMGSGQPVSTSTQGFPITASSLAAGPALGDALSRALGSQEVAAFDSFGAPFWFNAGAFTVAAPSAILAARLQEVLHPSPWQVQFQQAAPAHHYSHLSLAAPASRLTLSATVVQQPGRWRLRPTIGCHHLPPGSPCPRVAPRTGWLPPPPSPPSCPPVAARWISPPPLNCPWPRAGSGWG